MNPELQAEIAWRVETRELLAIELGDRVCDSMRPPTKQSANMFPRIPKRPTYGPIDLGDMSVEEHIFYTTDLQDPPTPDSHATE